MSLSIAYVSLLALWLAPVFVAVPVAANVVVTTAVILYIACHLSLNQRKQGGGGEQGDGAGVGSDKITAEDAVRFPIVGSGVLFGLFLVFKYLDKDIVNLVFSVYFSLLGTYAIGFVLEPMVSSVLGVDRQSLKSFGPEFNLPLLGPVSLRATWVEALCIVMAAPVAALYFRTKHWLLNNLLGISFALHGIEKMSLGSPKTGMILLAGLFFYDIFWVFGTDKILTGDSVMVTVAKSLDAPIKLLFPKPDNATVTEVYGLAVREFPGASHFSMLGLGDIVIPGLFIALLLRYDAERAGADRTEGPQGSFAKPFFHSNLLAYILGLGTTLYVMETFKAAQPALLYLVPACIGAALLSSAVLGEVSSLFAYDEEEKQDADGQGSEPATAPSVESKKKQ